MWHAQSIHFDFLYAVCHDLFSGCVNFHQDMPRKYVSSVSMNLIFYLCAFVGLGSIRSIIKMSPIPFLVAMFWGGVDFPWQ